jgi:hypothetical protein
MYIQGRELIVIIDVGRSGSEASSTLKVPLTVKLIFVYESPFDAGTVVKAGKFNAPPHSA